MPITAIQPSFAAGELAPALYSRVDLAQYGLGARTMKNLLVHPHGGASNRPGTEFIAAAKVQDQAVRLIPFEYSTEQAYVLEFGHLYMRVYANGGQVVSGGVPVEIVTPYQASELAQLQVTQSADVLFLAHPLHAPQMLSRLAANSWQLTTLSFAGGPLLPMNETATTLKITAQQQTIRPSSDVTTTGWTPSAGVDCYPMLADPANGSTVDLSYVSCTGTAALTVGMWNINAGTELRGWYLYVRCSATALSDGSVELLIPDTKEPPSWHTLRKWGIRVGTAFTTYVFFLPAQDAALLSRLRATVTLTNGKISVIELRAPYHPLSAYNQAALSDASLVAGTSATLDAGANIFDAGHVGALFGILGKTKAASYVVLSPAKGTWTSSVFPVRGSWNITLECISPGNRDQAALYLERSLDEGSSWQRVYAWPPTAATTQMALSGTEVAPCLMRFVRDEDPTSGDEVKFTLSVAGEEAWAFFRVTAVGLANSATVTLLTDYDHPGTTFLTWAEGAWSDVRGWPACVSFFEDRLVFANTKTQPQTLWMSRTSSYLDFSASIPVQDDDAVTATLVSRKVNAIRAILSMGDLLVLTSGAEYRVGTDGNGPITPTNISARPQGYRGAAAVDPEPVGNTLLYVQSKGAAIRELAFDNNAQGYDGNDVSVLSKHLLEGHSLLELAYQQEPWSVLWGVRDDGVLLGLTYMREHQVFAWHWHETQGAIEAVCTIPGAGEDEVWFVARRTVGGSTKRYIERLASRRSEDLLEAHFVDSGLDYSGDPAAVLSGLDHLEGCTVTALADGVVRAGLTVTGGQVTLPFAASRVHVGLPYTSDLETLGIEYQANGGTAQGKLKRIGAVTLRISNSRGGKAGPDAAHLEALSYPSEVTGPYSGDRKVHLKSTYDTAGRVFIRQSDPLPFTVLAVIPEVTSGE